MRRNPIPSGAAMTAAALLAAGCASPERNAIFVTKTSLAIVDVDVAPAGISIAYDRSEDYFGPRFASGEVAPVAGSFETDGRILNRRIRQLYATGEAAVRVSSGKGPEPVSADVQAARDAAKAAEAAARKAQDAADAAQRAAGGVKPDAIAASAQTRPMFFGTGTTIGLKIGFSSSTPPLPSSFTFGYKRKEASVIPVDDGVFPPVIGSLNNDTDARADGDARPAPEFAVTQYFATGRAALALAGRTHVLDAFDDRSKQALTPLAQFRTEEAQQGKHALDLLLCLDGLDATKFARALNNAEDLEVFNASALAAIRAQPPERQPRKYAQEISVLNAKSALHTKRLALHREVVCRIAGK